MYLYILYIIGFLFWWIFLVLSDGWVDFPYRPPGYHMHSAFSTRFLSSNCTKNLILFHVKSECTPFLRHESLYIASLSFVCAIFCCLLSSAGALWLFSFGSSAAVKDLFCLLLSLVYGLAQPY